ncbi:MAG: alpha/beta hydrolase [Amylibacter sp.]|nr:alpha/beta hydrolase [Amylibacter sp.]
MYWVLFVVLLGAFGLLTLFRAQKFTQKAETDTPPIGQFIKVGGQRIHYIKQGSGPVLLMIHGAGGHVKDFTYDHVTRFAKDFTVVAFDRPGHGYTPLLGKTATLAEQADLITKAATKLGITNAYIMGFSYGGALALHLATQYKDFVKGLVLISAVSMPWPGKINITYRLMAMPFIGPAMMAFATAYFGDAYFRATYATVFEPHETPKGYLDHVGVNMSVRYRHFVENSRQLQNLYPQVLAQFDHYKDLKIPIEMIHGTSDPTVPHHIHACEFIKIVPQANLVLMQDMGHGTHQLAIPEIEKAVDAMAASNADTARKA